MHAADYLFQPNELVYRYFLHLFYKHSTFFYQMYNLHYLFDHPVLHKYDSLSNKQHLHSLPSDLMKNFPIQNLHDFLLNFLMYFQNDFANPEIFLSSYKNHSFLSTTNHFVFLDKILFLQCWFH